MNRHTGSSFDSFLEEEGILAGRNRWPAPSIVLGAPASSRLVGEGTHAARLQGDVVPLAGWKPALPARSRAFQFAEIGPNATVLSLLPPLFLIIRAQATGCARVIVQSCGSAELPARFPPPPFNRKGVDNADQEDRDPRTNP